MSYVSAARKRENVIVWERTDEGRSSRMFRVPHYFYTKDPDGEYETMYGDRVEKHIFKTSGDFKNAKRECELKRVETFESDIPAELKILSEHYYNLPAPNLHVTFLDIEVDYDPEKGFSSIKNPYAPINSISMYHQHENKYVVLAVPPDDSWTAERLKKEVNDQIPLPDNMEYDIQLFKNETELLLNLVVEIEDSDILCGWNSDFFDMPYIAKRLEKIGKKYFNMLSFPDAAPPFYREVEKFKTMHITLGLCGRVSLDYLNLFRKYEMDERPSYKLESIADEVLPDLPKLKYEGSLANLYRNDFAFFVRYNIRDTEVLHGFEERLGYVQLANEMVHLSTGLFKHAGGTIKLAELATINYCHHELGGLVVNDLHIAEHDGQIQGAFVLVPQVGLHENISSVDIASLYPSAIRSINISPETIIGQLQALEYEKLTPELTQKIIDEKGRKEIQKATELKKSREVYASDLIVSNSDIVIQFTKENGETTQAPANHFRKEFKKNKWAVSGYGTVFNQHKQGIIPMILSDWYEQRTQYKKEMKKAKADGDKIKTTYYDKMQYVYKIKLNSFYGALTNKYFRFYDLRMGESTTGTGRKVLLHQCAKICEIIDDEYIEPCDTEFEYRSVGGTQTLRWHYGYPSKYSVVYGDTDSSYFVTHAKDADEATVFGDNISKMVNKSFPKFMRDAFLCTSGFDNIIQCEREVVSDRGIFVDKKRYILHLTNLDGYPVDKLKVMGLDTKKTTLPKEVSIVLNGFIERYLKGESWEDIELDIVEYKDFLNKTDNIMMIGLPKGVQKVEVYSKELKKDPGTRLPGHVAASIHYNLCLKLYNDRESMPIVSGTKIKVFYLTNKIERFKSIAIPVDIEQIPSWFLDNYLINKQDHIERLVDNPLNNILRAIKKKAPCKQDLFLNTTLEF